MKTQFYDLKLLTSVEVSTMLQIPVRTIHTLTRQGKIPGIKIGRLWRFRQEDVWGWIESGYQRTSEMKEIYQKAKEILDSYEGY